MVYYNHMWHYFVGGFNQDQLFLSYCSHFIGKITRFSHSVNIFVNSFPSMAEDNFAPSAELWNSHESKLRRSTQIKSSNIDSSQSGVSHF